MSVRKSESFCAETVSQETCQTRCEAHSASILYFASSTEVVMAQASVSSSTQIVSISDRMTAGILALLVGSFLIFGAGFAHSNVLHDTAHDVRHANGFPCH
jgi:cobalt transporter subunit CbtB